MDRAVPVLPIDDMEQAREFYVGGLGSGRVGDPIGDNPQFLNTRIGCVVVHRHE